MFHVHHFWLWGLGRFARILRSTGRPGGPFLTPEKEFLHTYFFVHGKMVIIPIGTSASKPVRLRPLCIPLLCTIYIHHFGSRAFCDNPTQLGEAQPKNHQPPNSSCRGYNGCNMTPKTRRDENRAFFLVKVRGGVVMVL